jgi:DNA-binding PadR family transcriptional regulator
MLLLLHISQYGPTMKTANVFESTKFYILLALAQGPNHGYAIRGQIISDTVGLYLRDSTLYSALKSLERAGLIEPGNSPDGRRILFQLTQAGWRKLDIESQTWKRAAELARRRLARY